MQQSATSEVQYKVIFADNSGSNVADNNDQEAIRRSSQVKQPSTHLQDYDLLHDYVVSSEGNLIHFAFIAEVEPLSFEDAKTNAKWWKGMQEKLD